MTVVVVAALLGIVIGATGYRFLAVFPTGREERR